MAKPRVLFLDIETTPALVYVWRIFKPHIDVDQIVTPTSVLCFAAQWMGEKRVLWERRAKNGNTKRLMQIAHGLLSKADVVVTYNGDSFDLPRLYAEFAIHNMPPAPPVYSIDLLQSVKRFGFTSRRLAHVGPLLKIGEKIRHEGWPLWIGCMNEDNKLWEQMETYNRQDVVLLSRLYDRILPWVKNAFPVSESRGSEHPTCPRCGGMRIKSFGVRATASYTYRRFQCMRCGGWMRQRTSERGSRTELRTL